MSKSPITCHVLDTVLGKPAKKVGVKLEKLNDANSWQILASGDTDADGRCSTLLAPSTKLAVGTYKMTFEVEQYYAASKTESFYPLVEVTFHYRYPEQHYHIPLLLSPHSYTTYRGS